MKKLDNRGFGLVGALLLVLAAAILAAAGTLVLRNNDKAPRVLVWGIDETVSVPKDLKKDLEISSKDDCKDYRGTDGPDGVTLFAVQKVNNDFAKMSYGCSDTLSFDVSIVAVKKDGKWELIQPVEYYEFNMPKCAVMDKYGIDRSNESECVSEEDIKANREMQSEIEN
jgi:hypothetical protein